jgi:hypothetical protein
LRPGGAARARAGPLCGLLLSRETCAHGAMVAGSALWLQRAHAPCERSARRAARRRASMYAGTAVTALAWAPCAPPRNWPARALSCADPVAAAVPCVPIAGRRPNAARLHRRRASGAAAQVARPAVRRRPAAPRRGSAVVGNRRRRRAWRCTGTDMGTAGPGGCCSVTAQRPRRQQRPAARPRALTGGVGGYGADAPYRDLNSDAAEDRTPGPARAARPSWEVLNAPP